MPEALGEPYTLFMDPVMGAASPIETGPRMETFRLESDADILQWDRLLAGAFPVVAGGSFFDDFPVWKLSSSDVCFRVGARNAEGELKAAVGCRLAELKEGAYSGQTVALLGGVVTSPDVRGRGLASTLLRCCMDWARHRGASYAFLWSSEESFYRRLGFESCGAQIRVPLDGFFSGVSGEEARTFQLRFGLNPQIERLLLEARVGGLVLRRRDLPWIRAHRNVEWAGLYSGREIRAYAAIGRGIDLPRCVHEWGGESRPLRVLLSLLADARSGLQLLAPLDGLDRLGLSPVLGMPESLVLGMRLDSPGSSIAEVFGGVDPARGAWRRGERKLWFWGLDGC